jgi:hypothetical protein
MARPTDLASKDMTSDQLAVALRGFGLHVKRVESKDGYALYYVAVLNESARRLEANVERF